MVEFSPNYDNEKFPIIILRNSRHKDLRKETISTVIKRVTKFRCWAFVCANQFLFYKMTNIGSRRFQTATFLFTAAADKCESRKLVISSSFSLCAGLLKHYITAVSLSFCDFIKMLSQLLVVTDVCRGNKFFSFVKMYALSRAIA